MVEAAPGIYVLQAFAAPEAAAIVAAAAASPAWRAAGINADLAIDRSIRNADVLHEEAQRELLGRCRDRLFAATRRLASALAPQTVLAEVQIVRYRAGGKYVEHRDTPALGETPRALSLVCYLNDDFTGGATVFPERDLTLAPSCGMVAVFSPVLLHRAEPVAAGTKFVVTAWYHVPPRQAVP
jgi:Rps23 Pro-64 3,4-dihydroxylase Tpa1-like proline 4-hydroxylase